MVLRDLSVRVGGTAAGAAVSTLFLSGCGGAPTADAASWPAHALPATRTVDVVDDYHGESIADPYRWLEDQDSDEVLAWADAQNAYTAKHLAPVQGTRDALRTRLTELWNYPRHSALEHHGTFWSYYKNDGLQNQAVLYRTDEPDRDGTVLLDPNTWSADGSVSLGGAEISEQGRYVAFSRRASGSDWQTWHVLDVATGRELDDELPWSKFSTAVWTEDEAGFFYQRYEAPADGEVYEAQTRGAQLCYHRVGTPPSEDEVVYERPDHPNWGYAPVLSDDGDLLVIHAWVGTDRRNRVFYVDLTDREAGVRPLLTEFDGSYDFLGRDGDSLYFLVDVDAPRNRIVAIDRTAPARDAWREVVPEQADKLESAQLLGNQFVCRYLRDARHEVVRFGLDGTALGAITLPELGSVGTITGKRDQRDCYLTFSSFTRPTTVLRYDFGSDELTVAREPELKFDPDRFVTRQEFLQSADGTRLPIFLVHEKGMKLDGSNPTYLYGYGGFNISLTPSFSVPNLVWCERGGLYAQVTLRGGGEYGEEWHEAGMLGKKQNVFDDFAAAADYLIRNDFTRADRLAIGGRSNGGLLVGATLNQHPELFGAAIPEVGVLDMLRYHEFTIGWAWVPEYGSSADAAMFPVLRAYSPLHNVRSDVPYPPTLVMTGDHDDRVLPGHSYKFAAALQTAQVGDAPILLRVSRKAGHGGGKPTTQLIEEAADRWAFLELALGGN